MGKYAIGTPKRRSHRTFWSGLAALVAVVAVIVGGTWHAYHQYLGPVSSDQRTTVLAIPDGSGVKQIAAQLQTAHLIRSSWAFAWYVHASGLSGKLQAGTYAFSPSQGVPAIVRILAKGQVANSLVTILPGKRLDQIRASLINDGFSPAAVDKALQPAQYAGLPVLALKPADVSTLEGLLYPDSFRKDAATDPSFIVKESLQEMNQRLTPQLRAAFTAEGLTPYQGVVLASIVEQEVSKPQDRSQVAQVFLKRLRTGMMLGSDVTLEYARTMQKLDPAGSYDAYDTTSHPGLPPSPIATISQDALQAAAHPAPSDWLYFVTGDDGVTHFSKTYDEHKMLTQQYCHALCSHSQ